MKCFKCQYLDLKDNKCCLVEKREMCPLPNNFLENKK